MSIVSKVRELLAGWSVWVLVKKLAGRVVPVASAGAFAFLSKWAPETAGDETKVKAAVALFIWAALESLRNAAVYALKKREDK